MNKDLNEGMTDGKYKKIANTDRGGFVEPTTYMDRMDLNDNYYGFHEAPNKVKPDGTVYTDKVVQTNSLPLNI
jgi:hypothetical protein